MTGGGVAPSSRIRPVRVEGNKDMFNLVQNRHAAAREGDDLHAHQADEAGVHAVREHLLEGEAAQVAAPR